MHLRWNQDFFAGLMFSAIGLFVIAYGSHYSTGEGGQIGPGDFPRALGCILVVLGLAVLFNGLRSQGEAVVIDRWALQSALIIPVSLVLFGFLLPVAGILVSIFVLVFISLLASRIFDLKFAVALSASLCAVSYLVFILGLGIRLPVLPDFGVF